MPCLKITVFKKSQISKKFSRKSGLIYLFLALLLQDTVSKTYVPYSNIEKEKCPRIMDILLLDILFFGIPCLKIATIKKEDLDVQEERCPRVREIIPYGLTSSAFRV